MVLKHHRKGVKDSTTRLHESIIKTSVILFLTVAEKLIKPVTKTEYVAV